MTKLTCLLVAGVALGLGGAPARAADDCATTLPELRAATQRPAVDEVTRGKINSLLDDAAGLCEEGAEADARTKFANVRELLEGDLDEGEGGSSDAD